MISSLKIFLLLIAAAFLVKTGCQKNEQDNLATLKELYNRYKDGDITECKFKGELVYIAGINAYDAGSAVFDKDGSKIGECNYAWGPVDRVCTQLQDCEVIYRCDNHITGKPPVDKYGLSKQ